MHPALRRPVEVLWSATSRPREAQWLYWAGWCVPPLLARALMNLGRGISPGVTDLRGVVSDLTAGLCGALLGLVVVRAFDGPPARWVVAALACIVALFHYAGFEHVLALDAPIDISLIGYLGDATFVAGSSGMVAHPVVLGVLVVFAPFAVHRGVSHLDPLRPRLGTTAAALAVMVLVGRVWTPSLSELSWRQLNFVEVAPSRVFGPGPSPPLDCYDPEIAQLFRAELEGERRTPVHARPPNVLLVMVEGMTGAYVPSLAQVHGMDYVLDMPRISARAEEHGLYFSTFINQQRQTNNGEHALLCGEYPKLSSETSKMSDYVIESGRPCLPTVLRDAGYHTAYLQAANLSFMMKDQFMALAGFDDVLGAESFTKGYARSGWGVDDRGLYEGVLERLVAYEHAGKPWFAAVMTVGTHAPFPVPEDFEGVADEPPVDRAFRYADLALHELLEGLDRKGLADHTLVLITSDESAGIAGDEYDDFTQLLSKNWGVMFAFGPGVPAEHEPAHFTQSDVAISVLDYLGLADTDTHFDGRSFFRRYEKPRRIGFANTYAQTQYALDPRGHLVACPETSDDCVGYQLDPDRIFADQRAPRSVEADEIAFLRGLVARSEITPASRLRQANATQEFELISPVAGLVDLEPTGERTSVLSGQAIRVPPGHRYHVELRYRAIGPDVTVFADNDLRTRLETVRFQPWGAPIREGEIVTLEYDYVPDELVYDVDVSLRAFKQSKREGGAILVEKAIARLEPPAPGATPTPGVNILDFSVTRRDGAKERLPYHEVTLESAQFWRAACVKENKQKPKTSVRWRGRGCREGEIIRGPGSAATGGSIVRGRVVLVGTKGAGRGHLELRAWRGVEKLGDLAEYGRQQRFRIAPGQRVELNVEETMQIHHRGVNLVLVLDQADELDFDVESLQFEVSPPRSQVRWADDPGEP